MRERLAAFLENTIGTGFFVPDYAFLYSLAILVALYLIIRRSGKAGLDEKTAFRAALVMAGAAVLSSRLFVVVQHAGYHIDHPQEIFSLWGVDTASTGGYIGAFLGALLAAKYYRISAGELLDCAAPGAALAMCLGRIGCFLNGCCYGSVSDLPWAVRFPEGSGPHYAHSSIGAIVPGQLSLPVHPTQLYEAAYALALFCILLKAEKSIKREGGLFALLFVLYMPGRILNEFLRADQERGFIYSFSVPQVFGFCAAALALAYLRAKRKPSGEHLAIELDSLSAK